MIKWQKCTQLSASSESIDITKENKTFSISPICLKYTLWLLFCISRKEKNCTKREIQYKFPVLLFFCVGNSAISVLLFRNFHSKISNDTTQINVLTVIWNGILLQSENWILRLLLHISSWEQPFTPRCYVSAFPPISIFFIKNQYRIPTFKVQLSLFFWSEFISSNICILLLFIEKY